MGNIILFPTPPQTYDVETKNIRSHLVWIPVNSGLYNVKGPKTSFQTGLIDCQERQRRGTTLLCLQEPFRFPALFFHGNRQCVFIYFHGNSTDLGDIYDEMHSLSDFLDCNILAIEYPGYGICSTMSVQPELINLWGQSAVHWLLALGVPPECIILFGRSIGTGPAAQTAAFMVKEKLQPGGLILHSPFLSIHKIVSEYTYLGTWLIRNYWDTETLLKAIHPYTPLLVIHGRNDEVIPVHHGRQLLSQYAAADPSFKGGYFPYDCPHNGYLVLDDLAVPIRMFFYHRHCFQYQSEKHQLKISDEDKHVPFNYDFNVLSRSDSMKLSDSLERQDTTSTTLNLKFFSVQVSPAKNENTCQTEDLITAISTFEDIPITRFSETCYSKQIGI